jgi:hypothetical protein
LTSCGGIQLHNNLFVVALARAVLCFLWFNSATSTTFLGFGRVVSLTILIVVFVVVFKVFVFVLSVLLGLMGGLNEWWRAG